MKYNSSFIIDIETCLITTKSGRKYPIDITDWVFKSNIIKYINESDFDYICLVADKPVDSIFSIKVYEDFLKVVYDELEKRINKPLNCVFNPVKDEYYNYPNPGGLFNYFIEYDIDISKCLYVSESNNAIRLSGISNSFDYINFITNGNK